MSKLIKTVVPFSWNPITLAFTRGQVGTVNLAASLRNPESRVVTYGVWSGALPAGCTLNPTSGVVSYDGSGTGSTQATVQFSASQAGGFTVESAATVATITAASQGNQLPVWQTNATLGPPTVGVPFSYTLVATDADGDPISFVYNAPLIGSVTVGAQVNLPNGTSQRSLTWAGTAPDTQTYTLTVDARDTPPLGQVTGVTAQALNPNTVRVGWAALTGATSYAVERSLTGTGSWTAAGTSTTSPLDVGFLSPSTTYYFRVIASNATEVGISSAVVFATTPAIATGTDWDQRASGPGVRWSHNFEREEEFSKFAVMQGQQTGGAATPYPITAPKQLVPKRVFDSQGGFYCVEYINFGNTLRDAMTISDTTMTLNDASDFPDPVAAGLTGYRIAVKHEDNKNSPSLYERMYVTAKSGNTLTVMRDVNSDGSLMAHAAGSRVGYDSEGRWSRPLACFKSPGNGRLTDDLADGGIVTKHDWDAVTGSDPGVKLDRFNEGYYTHVDYKNKWPTTLPNGGGAVNPWWDGDEFYLQYAMKISANRYLQGNEARATKTFFLWNCAESGYAQLVGSSDASSPAQGEMTSRWWWFHAYGDARGGECAQLTSPQGGKNGSTYQPGSPGAAQCIRGSGNDLSGCWQWPVDKWVTVLLHMKCGHFGCVQAGFNPSDHIPRGTITVQGMTPTNNGVDTLTFETNVVPDPAIWTFPGGNYISHGTTDYFNHWIGEFFTGALDNATFKVVSYTNIGGGRVRWTLGKRTAGAAWNTGVPAIGDQFGVEYSSLFDDVGGANPRLKYPDWILEAWTAVDNQPYVRVFGPPTNVPGYYLIFGNSFVGDMSKNPPGYSMFAPTGYQNLDVGAVPPAVSYSYKFGRFILSSQMIPAPKP